MRLTHKNYFTAKNKHISNSKVNDFLLSKEYYYKKHIARTIKEELTPSMQVGKMVDLYVSSGKPSEIAKEFSIKVLKSENPELYEAQKLMDQSYIVSKDIYDRAITMGKKIVESNLYRWWKEYDAQFQVLLTATYSDVPVCGIADVITVRKDMQTIFIDDIKTAAASAMKSPYAWVRHCEEYGYLRQLAHYKAMVQFTPAYPNNYDIVCRHLVIGNQASEWHPIQVYEFSDELLQGWAENFRDIALAISKEKSWKDHIPSWGQALKLYPYEADARRADTRTH